MCVCVFGRGGDEGLNDDDDVRKRSEGGKKVTETRVIPGIAYRRRASALNSIKSPFLQSVGGRGGRRYEIVHQTACRTKKEDIPLKKERENPCF